MTLSQDITHDNKNFCFQFQNLKSPRSTKPTSSLVVVTSRTSTILIDRLSSGATFTASADNLLDVSIEPQDKTIYAVTSYVIELKLKNEIGSDGYLSIEFPIEVQLVNTISCQLSSRNSVSIKANPRVEQSGQVVRIKEMSTSTIGGNTELRVVLS